MILNHSIVCIIHICINNNKMEENNMAKEIRAHGTIVV